MDETDIAESVEACSQLMVQILERLAGQLDDFADGLLLMAALMVQTQASGAEKAAWLWSEMGRMAQQLRDQVGIAHNWERRAATEGWADLPGLQAAFDHLARSARRAALFLGRVDVLLATTGPDTKAIKDEV